MADSNFVGRITMNGVNIPLATSPYIGTNGNWWIWDVNQQQFVLITQ